MNSTVNEITKSIIGKFSLYEYDTDELQQLTSQYPFFGPAQFLLARKMKQAHSPLFTKHIQKASLYFQNPVWFDHLLGDIDSDPDTDVTDNTRKNEKAFFLPLAEMEIPATYEVVLDQTKTEQAVDSTLEKQAEPNQPGLFIKFPKFKFEPIDTSKTNIPPTNDNEIVNEPKMEEIENSVAEKLPEQHQPELSEILPKFNLDPVDFSKAEIPATDEEADKPSTTQEDEDRMAEDQDTQNQPALMVEFSKFNFEPIDPAKAELSFEPYHTIDYFASQGIRNKEEEKPKDKLSRQLKSFTEWLKIMKRLPVSEIAATVSATDEKKVEQMAEISIHDREVVTEAMAEVWEKQGNKARATEVYEKLSLLNPGKSSYFAAKIEHLKNL